MNQKYLLIHPVIYLHSKSHTFSVGLNHSCVNTTTQDAENLIVYYILYEAFYNVVKKQKYYCLLTDFFPIIKHSLDF